MSAQPGGPQNIGFLPQDRLNLIHRNRRKSMEKGGRTLDFEVLGKKKSEDRAFTYEMQVEEDNMITNNFWADGRAILDCSFFGGDVF